MEISILYMNMLSVFYNKTKQQYIVYLRNNISRMNKPFFCFSVSIIIIIIILCNFLHSHSIHKHFFFSLSLSTFQKH